MNRRAVLIALSAAGLGWQGAALSQEKAKPVVGFLGIADPGGFAASMASFHKGLRETGYVEGQNLSIEYRWAEGRTERLPALTAELVGRKVDVIFTSGGLLAALAAKQATGTIPIVFETGIDPVEKGLVTSYARPGGNLTPPGPPSPACVLPRLLACRWNILARAPAPGPRNPGCTRWPCITDFRRNRALW
jgi:putative ABC transport system substrate-binding protein